MGFWPERAYWEFDIGDVIRDVLQKFGQQLDNLQEMVRPVTEGRKPPSVVLLGWGIEWEYSLLVKATASTVAVHTIQVALAETRVLTSK